MSKDTEVLDIVYQMMPDGIVGDLMTGSDSNLEVIMRACYNSEVLNLAEYRDILGAFQSPQSMSQKDLEECIKQVVIQATTAMLFNEVCPTQLGWVNNCVTRRFPTDTRAVLVEVAPVGIFYQVVRNGFGTSGKRSTNNRGHFLEERTHFYLIIWLVFRLVLATLGSTPLSSSLTLRIMLVQIY